MVEQRQQGGKNSDMTMGSVLVVAGALRGTGAGGRVAFEDSWLMQRRPFEKHHGGLWEFPGGKVEDTESPVKALVRELAEELGIAVLPEDCTPTGFAEEKTSEGTRPPIVLLLYTVRAWEGEPRALEGGAVGWFTPDAIESLAKPPLDSQLAAQLFEKFRSAG